jgi:hypothetical protein
MGSIIFGVYHFARAGEVSWFALAAAIIDIRAAPQVGSPQVVRVRIVDDPTPAMRPPTPGPIGLQSFGNSVLVCGHGARRVLANTIDGLRVNKDVR